MRREVVLRNNEEKTRPHSRFVFTLHIDDTQDKLFSLAIKLDSFISPVQPDAQ